MLSKKVHMWICRIFFRRVKWHCLFIYLLISLLFYATLKTEYFTYRLATEASFKVGFCFT